MTTPTTAPAWDRVPHNLQRIQRRIVDAAEAAGRDPADVRLVAVSKTFPIEALRVALDAGQTLFGENRVQEALPKIDALTGSDARFHLIGHLQTNKARHGGAFDMIESVDSVRLAVALERRLPGPIPVLLEVNVAGEASKQGFAPAELSDALATIQPLANLQVVGLMTVAPLSVEAERARPIFAELRRLRDANRLDEPRRGQRSMGQLSMGQLSMGMSNDFEVAIAEGATIVRIGRAIFGDR